MYKMNLSFAMYLYAEVIFPPLQINHFQQNSHSNYMQLLIYLIISEKHSDSCYCK